MIYPSAQSAKIAAPVTILVVDDELTSVAVLESVLKSAGYQLATAANGREALGQDAAADA